MARLASCLILLLGSCVVDREMYDGRYETEAALAAGQEVSDFGQAMQGWADWLAPSQSSRSS
jgi:hypothetical protein